MQRLFRITLFTLLLPFGLLLPVPSFATTGCNAIWHQTLRDMSGCMLGYPAIASLFDAGIIHGKPASESRYGKGSMIFDPQAPVNRAEFTRMLLLSLSKEGTGAILPCTAKPFKDVELGQWYSDSICTTKSLGIVTGFPDGTFKPAETVNFANGATMLAKSFRLPIIASDAVAATGTEQRVWFRPYTMALLRKNALAPTIESFAQLLNRGEVAEMLYRLRTGKTSQDKPPFDPYEEDLAGLGTGAGPYWADPLGFSTSYPDAPFILTPHTLTLPSKKMVKGFRFSHTVNIEAWTASGLFEHVKPQLRDWSIGFYSVDSNQADLQKYIDALDDPPRRFFGGTPGRCGEMGYDGINEEWCLFPTPKHGLVLSIFHSTNPAIAYPLESGITPLPTQEAYYARLRKDMRFTEY